MDKHSGQTIDMTTRNTLIDEFLTDTDWTDATRLPLAGDASNRRYLRLSLGSGRTAVLMDAPPEKGEDIQPFVSISGYLSGIRLSAPEIIKQDSKAGLLLLEDLGDDLYARHLERNPQDELCLYTAAVDVLVHLHRQNPPSALETYCPDRMADLAGLAFDWYLTHTLGPNTDAKQVFTSELRTLLGRLNAKPVLIQRDYHAENLLWLPERSGVRRVGLLDFQDALLGHPAYDLVSLLEDARRDVSPETPAAMIKHYLDATGQNPEDFSAGYALMGVQRNLRIIGVFTRLCIRDGKKHYVDLIPRVWNHLQNDLSHSVCAPLFQSLSALPPPNLNLIDAIKTKCATLQNQ